MSLEKEEAHVASDANSLEFRKLIFEYPETLRDDILKSRS